MPSREWPLRIQDILDSISEINQRTQAMTFEEFMKNQTIVKSVLYDLIIIEEDLPLLVPQLQELLENKNNSSP